MRANLILHKHRSLGHLPERRLPQIHIPPHTLTAIACRKPQVQPVRADGHVVSGPSVRRGPLGAVFGAVDPPCACAFVVGCVDCAAVGVELLGGAAFIGDYAGGEGLGYGGGVERVPVFGQGGCRS